MQVSKSFWPIPPSPFPKGRERCFIANSGNRSSTSTIVLFQTFIGYSDLSSPFGGQGASFRPIPPSPFPKGRERYFITNPSNISSTSTIVQIHTYIEQSDLSSSAAAETVG